MTSTPERLFPSQWPPPSRITSVLAGDRRDQFCLISYFGIVECGLSWHFHLNKQISQRSEEMGLPWWCSGQESACQCKGHGFNLWFRKIPHVEGQLSPCNRSYWACMPRACAHNMRSQYTTTKSSPHAATKTQHNQKNKWMKILKICLKGLKRY